MGIFVLVFIFCTQQTTSSTFDHLIDYYLGETSRAYFSGIVFWNFLFEMLSALFHLFFITTNAFISCMHYYVVTNIFLNWAVKMFPRPMNSVELHLPSLWYPFWGTLSPQWQCKQQTLQKLTGFICNVKSYTDSWTYQNCLTVELRNWNVN